VLPIAEFELLVENALRGIPWRFRRHMENVAIVVEQEPRRPGLLDLYEGRPLASRSVFEGFAMPDKITIFQGPHERWHEHEHSSNRWWLIRSGMRSRTTSEWTKRKCARQSGGGAITDRPPRTDRYGRG
jgi:Zincin-like metallopeptidase